MRVGQLAVIVLVWLVALVAGVDEVSAFGQTICSATVEPEFREPDQNEIEFYFDISNQSTSPELPTAEMAWVIIRAPAGVEMVGGGADVSGGNFFVYTDRVEFDILDGRFATGTTEEFKVVVHTGSGGAYGVDFIVEAISVPDEGEEFAVCPVTLVVPTPEPTPTAVPTPTPETIIVEVTSETTVTATPTPSPTPAPTPVPDTTPPTVSFISDFSEPVNEAPEITGKVSDNRIVSLVEYSVDGGVNWLPVDVGARPGVASGVFSFTPQLSEDGNYTIVSRARDGEGNVRVSSERVLIIDRLPPIMGGFSLSLGAQQLGADSKGRLVTMVGVAQTMTLSGVGGPTEVKLVSGGEEFLFERSIETGLWTGEVSFERSGVYDLEIVARDGAGNETRRDYGQAQVIGAGEVTNSEGEKVEQSELTVWFRDPQTQDFVVWDGPAFGQVNPQVLGSDGYGLFLPPGEYYFEARAPGYRRVVSQIVRIEEPRPVNADYVLEGARGFFLGPWFIGWPDFLTKPYRVEVRLPAMVEGDGGSELVGEEALGFALADTEGGEVTLTGLVGKPLLMSFVNSWSPQSQEQIPILDELFSSGQMRGVMVFAGESEAKVKVFRARGKYQSTFVVDADSSLVEEYGVSGLPTHYFLDEEGRVVRVVGGVLSGEEIIQVIGN